MVTELPKYIEKLKFDQEKDWKILKSRTWTKYPRSILDRSYGETDETLFLWILLAMFY